MVQDLSYHEIAITPLQHVRGRIKWPHTTPEGKTLLRCYVGRAGDEAVVEQTEEELVQLVLEDLRKTMDITEDPEFTIVSRWKEAMPQYTVGHNERMKSSQHLWRKSCQVYTWQVALCWCWTSRLYESR